jgi:ADP-heptose:LPS heptosyltransferase
VAGQLGLGAYAALLAAADLFVGNDTGPAHMAFALSVPSVVIYWCGNVITAGPPTRRIFRPVLSWTVDCPACGQRDCRCQVPFVAEAPLEEVLEHAEDLLEGGSSSPARPE